MEHYAYPLALNPLPAHLRLGLIGLATCGLLSLVSTAGAVGFIVYRMSNHKKYQATPLRYNMPLVLILNLLIADLQQAASFAISLHWLGLNSILAPTHACSAQGWLIQIGDVASGVFALAVAAQTFCVMVLRRDLSYAAFVWCILAIWAFCVLLSLISPILHHNEALFVPTGAWCWISGSYHDERLFVHYIWIFACEVGTVILYATTFLVLRHNFRTNAVAGVRGGGGGGASPGTATINRVARLMLVYPIAYTCLTLPLAAYRMLSLAPRHQGRRNDTFQLLAGACMASCGWVDVILYFVTRRSIVILHHRRRSHRHRTPRSGGMGDTEMNPELAYRNVATGGGRDNGGDGGGGRAGRSGVSGPGEDRRSGDGDGGGDGDPHGVQGTAPANRGLEGLVKNEQVVQLTVEQGTFDGQAVAELATQN